MLEISLARSIFATSDESVILLPLSARLVCLQDWSWLTCQASTGNEYTADFPFFCSFPQLVAARRSLLQLVLYLQNASSHRVHPL
jgi:hypothetical protein